MKKRLRLTGLKENDFDVLPKGDPRHHASNARKEIESSPEKAKLYQAIVE